MVLNYLVFLTIKIENYQKTNKNQGKQSKMMKNNQKINKNNQKSIEKRENGLGRAGAHFHVFRLIFDCFC